MLRFWKIAKSLMILQLRKPPKFFDHQERVLTQGVQDVEKGVSDKEDNVNVDD